MGFVRLRRPLCFSLALFLIAPSSACISVRPDPEQAARGTVLIGYVTGEQYPDYEAALIRTPDLKWKFVGRHIVRVTPTEALHGELLGPVELVTPCYASDPKPGERAIVILYSGQDYVVPADAEYEQAIRDAIARHKSRKP